MRQRTRRPRGCSTGRRLASAVSLIIGAKNETELWQRYAVGSRMFVPVPFYGFDLFDAATGSLVHGGGWGVSDDFLVRLGR